MSEKMRGIEMKVLEDFVEVFSKVSHGTYAIFMQPETNQRMQGFTRHPLIWHSGKLELARNLTVAT